MVAQLEAVYCGECGALIFGGSCPAHPEALAFPGLIDEDSSDIFMSNVPLSAQTKDDALTQACKRLIMVRCSMFAAADWADQSDLPAIKAILDRQAAELYEIIAVVNPELAVLLNTLPE